MNVFDEFTATHFYATATAGEVRRVCDAAEVTAAYFDQLAKGRLLPSRKLALRLERVTNGRMNAVALLGLQESVRKVVGICEHEACRT